MAKHSNESVRCQACFDKLMGVRKELRDIFWYHIKVIAPNAHVSSGWRDKTEQNQYHAEGRSNAPWPKSNHNHLDDLGNPDSLAIDIFELCDNGMASWRWIFFHEIAAQLKLDGVEFNWGGDFTKLKDGPHFELKS